MSNEKRDQLAREYGLRWGATHPHDKDETYLEIKSAHNAGYDARDAEVAELKEKLEVLLHARSNKIHTLKAALARAEEEKADLREQIARGALLAHKLSHNWKGTSNVCMECSEGKSLLKKYLTAIRELTQ